jgi:hypothetical protein
MIAQMACYALPALIIYNGLQGSKEHEPIAEVSPPFDVNHGRAAPRDGEERYQNLV